MFYDIIGTGSKGNAVVIGRKLFDAGLPFKQIEPHIDEFDDVYITHRHSDHFRVSTILKLAKLGKTIYVPTDMLLNVPDERLIGILKPAFISPAMGLIYPINHDVDGNMYTFYEAGKHVIYATDTRDFKAIPPDAKFDAFFIEANHDEYTAISASLRGNVHAYGALRHASYATAQIFYLEHRASEDALLVELHASKRFA
jgi:ribonuclease BN (tRNA processing enzyme)